VTGPGPGPDAVAPDEEELHRRVALRTLAAGPSSASLPLAASIDVKPDR
jgi:hypothetical protein